MTLNNSGQVTNWFLYLASNDYPAYQYAYTLGNDNEPPSNYYCSTQDAAEDYTDYNGSLVYNYTSRNAGT